MKTSCARFKLTILAIFVASFAHAQYFQEFIPKEKRKPTYVAFGIGLPVRSHFDKDARVDNYRWLPDGINTKFGAGFHYNRWVSIGLHTGTDYRISEKLFAVPAYVNLRLALKITDFSRIYVQPGYGYVFALGRGNLGGDYKKISVGLEDDQSAISVFAEFAEYGFSRDNTGSIRSLSIGLGLYIF